MPLVPCPCFFFLSPLTGTIPDQKEKKETLFARFRLSSFYLIQLHLQYDSFILPVVRGPWGGQGQSRVRENLFLSECRNAGMSCPVCRAPPAVRVPGLCFTHFPLTAGRGLLIPTSYYITEMYE